MEDKQKKTQQQQEQGINIAVGGNADLKGVALGNQNQLVTDAHVQGSIVQAAEGAQVDISSTIATQEGLTLEELLTVFERLSGAVDEIEEVSRKAKIQAKAEVDLAVAELEEPEDGKEPDKKTVAEHLKNATETLKTAGATALQAATFGKLVGQAVSWLGSNYQWLIQML